MESRAVVGFARAFAGALIFALPMMMTMELWRLGFIVSPLKLALLFVVMLPLLTGLSWIGGFEPTSSRGDDIIDALVAVAIAASMSLAILWLFRIIEWGMPASEILGKLTLQTFAGSFGAILARSQLSASQSSKPNVDARKSYLASLIVMCGGALFLGLNIAPTEEVILLSYKMDLWRLILLTVTTLVLMHGFVYFVGFRGTPDHVAGETFVSQFARYTVVGYALSLIIGLYLLWSFGRTEGTSLGDIVSASVVLGFPNAIGAAASRLII
jgi:putative integral membrane protein (TIGR02587 family)